MTKTVLTDLTIQRLKAPTTGQLTVFDAGLKGFGIRLSQGGSKSFIVVTGINRKLTTLGRYPEMGLKQARLEAKKLQTVQTPTRPSTLYLEAFPAFLGHVRPRTKKATHDQYESYLRKVTFNKNLDSITRQDIAQELKKFEETPTAQNYAFATLRAFFNWCVEQEILYVSPMMKMKAPNRLQSRERVLNTDEIRAIWNATDYHPFGHYVRLLLLTGQRKMEIYNLKDITDVLTFPDTKNGKSHVIPVTPMMKPYLKPYNINHWSTQKDRLDRLSGITGWRLHDCRRSAATIMASIGIQPVLIERILNHTQQGISAIYQRYSYQKEIREALLTYHAHLQTILEPRA